MRVVAGSKMTLSFGLSNAVRSGRFPILAAAALLACTGAHAQDPAQPAMDGGYEDIDDGQSQSDPQFRSLFMRWKQGDSLNQAGALIAPTPGAISVPSLQPVTLTSIKFTSGFGVRSDPFRSRRAMHAGIDLAGPMGTPIYATADGVVSKAGWNGGYGNLVQISHGRGIETRYGHLSKLLVKPNSRVHRGQLIALMGSTGRSTGSHLHYEVRIDGHAVNPVPYLQSAEYLAAFEKRVGGTQVALGGPAAAD